MSTQKKSTQYTYLEKRINKLKRNFNFKQSINGITELQSDKLRGLILLCHAELEDYFESMAAKLLEEAEKKWKTRKVANYNLASLFIWNEKINTSGTCDTKAMKIITDFRSGNIKKNNGIKENDIKNLFEPLGYYLNDFDSTFLSTLSSFGSLRGEAAHTSVKKTQQLLDKNTEYMRIDNLLSGIADFEDVINQRR
ncbi:hypothetical protein E9840_08520 [Tissierella creatinini]|nr:hypothetical protein E9840_08520 [Tissierella creatinini]TJX59256.1 hypothetical protein E8P77_21610 [Soehngenia saccharolytica]